MCARASATCHGRFSIDIFLDCPNGTILGARLWKDPLVFRNAYRIISYTQSPAGQIEQMHTHFPSRGYDATGIVGEISSNFMLEWRRFKVYCELRLLIRWDSQLEDESPYTMLLMHLFRVFHKTKNLATRALAGTTL